MNASAASAAPRASSRQSAAAPPARPWYREPWTWALIGLPAAAVIGSLTSAALAIQNADPLVEDNYYQRGLEINTTLKRVSNAAAWGVHASVEYDGLRPGETVWVKARSTQPVHDAALQIRLVHPARGGADRQAILARVPGSPDTEAEFTGQWPEGAAADAGRASDGAVNWRIALQGQDWQVEGDALGRNDISAH
jgi:hypothetical protein